MKRADPKIFPKDFRGIAKESKTVQSEDPLVHFFYHLMRDHLPTGVVHQMMMDAVEHNDAGYCNGWLARYANYLAGVFHDRSPRKST